MKALSVVYKNQKQPYMIIGEDHDGGFGMPDKRDVENVMIHAPTLWYEGKKPSASVSAFKTKFNLRPQYMKSWEPANLRYSPDQIATLYFGGSPKSYADKFASRLTGKKTVLEVFVEGAGSYLFDSTMVPYITPERLTKLAKGTPVERALTKPATTSNLKDMILTAHQEIFERRSSQMYRLQDEFNNKRRKSLVQYALSKGGIFMIGDSHIVDVRKLLP